MINTVNPLFRVARVRCNRLALLCVALALGGCGKPSPRAPEKALVRTAEAKAMDNVAADGETSYLALVKFDHETDLSLKWEAFWSASGRRPAQTGTRGHR